jgi:hypothetical protein
MIRRRLLHFGRPFTAVDRRVMVAPMRITRLDRVQLAMFIGGDDLACAFYNGALGIPARQKPATLAKRCGCWFERGELKIRRGVELDFRPARTAHPACRLIDLPARIERLEALGYKVRQGKPLQGFHRVDVGDPFGIRIELIEPVST